MTILELLVVEQFCNILNDFKTHSIWSAVMPLTTLSILYCWYQKVPFCDNAWCGLVGL